MTKKPISGDKKLMQLLIQDAGITAEVFADENSSGSSEERGEEEDDDDEEWVFSFFKI